MKVRVRFTRNAFYGVPPLCNKAVELPQPLITAQQASFVFDCPDEDFYAEGATEFDRLMWEAFELYGGYAAPIETPGPGGWTLHWSSWTWDHHPTPA